MYTSYTVLTERQHNINQPTRRTIKHISQPPRPRHTDMKQKHKRYKDSKSLYRVQPTHRQEQKVSTINDLVRGSRFLFRFISKNSLKERKNHRVDVYVSVDVSGLLKGCWSTGSVTVDLRCRCHDASMGLFIKE
ncbi:hypothetical protein VTN00DRAFT_106 [Thermoascus crustaceus]|uniref:uncharacterized protein n=1 Tax=Thermoascus crustaceus TaxID=5088 RepID=UPI003742F53E